MHLSNKSSHGVSKILIIETQKKNGISTVLSAGYVRTFLPSLAAVKPTGQGQVLSGMFLRRE
jgi:hypothetical protein